MPEFPFSGEVFLYVFIKYSNVLITHFPLKIESVKLPMFIQFHICGYNHKAKGNVNMPEVYDATYVSKPEVCVIVKSHAFPYWCHGFDEMTIYQAVN